MERHSSQKSPTQMSQANLMTTCCYPGYSYCHTLYMWFKPFKTHFFFFFFICTERITCNIPVTTICTNHTGVQANSAYKLKGLRALVLCYIMRDKLWPFLTARQFSSCILFLLNFQSTTPATVEMWGAGCRITSVWKVFQVAWNATADGPALSPRPGLVLLGCPWALPSRWKPCGVWKEDWP